MVVVDIRFYVGAETFLVVLSGNQSNRLVLARIGRNDLVVYFPNELGPEVIVRGYDQAVLPQE